MIWLGALATFLAFTGGFYLAARYGRRASVSLSGEVGLLPRDLGVVFVIRPVVRGVGVFKVAFRERLGATRGGVLGLAR
jgi:hypothetical protein